MPIHTLDQGYEVAGYTRGYRDTGVYSGLDHFIFLRPYYTCIKNEAHLIYMYLRVSAR